MKRIDTPDGGWAEIRDVEEITTRGRRGIQAISIGLGDAIGRLQNITAETKILDLGLDEGQADAFLRMQEATIAAFIGAWSRPEPVTIETVGDLPSGLFDFLAEQTKEGGAEIALNTDATDVPDPKDPSGLSEPSDGLSRDDSAPTSTLP